MRACSHFHAEKVTMDRALMRAVASGNADAVGVVLAAGDKLGTIGETALVEAAANGHAAIVLILLEVGVCINSVRKCGQPPLSWAATNGHLSVVTTLLARDYSCMACSCSVH
jgi:ankyrin repeat protein